MNPTKGNWENRGSVWRAHIKSRADGVNREHLLMQHRCLNGEPNLSAEAESWPHKGENCSTPSGWPRQIAVGAYSRDEIYDAEVCTPCICDLRNFLRSAPTEKLPAGVASARAFSITTVIIGDLRA